MARFIIKLTDDKQEHYLEYSTIVDKPITYGMNLQSFIEYYKNEYGDSDLYERLKRVELNGSSGHYPFNSVDSVITQTQEELLTEYCKSPLK